MAIAPLMAILGVAACAGTTAPAAPSPAAIPAGAADASATPPVSAASSASPDLTPAPSSAPSTVRLTPKPTHEPTATPKLVTGVFSVSRDGITMSVKPEDVSQVDGRLRLAVARTGLASGEAVSVSSTGKYRIGWVCGAFQGETTGTDEATGSAVAESDGEGTTKVELVAVPPAECSTDPGGPRQTLGGACWERIEVTDPVHRLRATTEPACTGP